jgi:hypothetical protein
MLQYYTPGLADFLYIGTILSWDYYVQDVTLINIIEGHFFTGCFVPDDVLSCWTFCPKDVLSQGRLVPEDVLSHWTFCLKDVLSLWTFCLKDDLSLDVWSQDVWPQDVLSMYPFIAYSLVNI